MDNEPFNLHHTPSDAEEADARCHVCGRMIIWARNHETGKDVPLDPAAPVYELGYGPHGERDATRINKALVSHFATCSHANQFSGSRKS